MLFSLHGKKPKALVPTSVQCTEYVPRTGAFAYLGDKCARCNAELKQHKKATVPQIPRRNQGEVQYWLLRDICSDSGWALRSRLQVMMDTCWNLADLHAVGLSYGPTLRATAIMCTSQGKGALRRPLVMPPLLDPFDHAHVARCGEDMLWFGKLLELVGGTNNTNESLNALISQLLDESAENRPDAEATAGWLEGIIQDMQAEFDVPRFASSRHPFYGFIDLVTKENLKAIVNKSEDGYESDDSFHPLGNSPSKNNSSNSNNAGAGSASADEDGESDLSDVEGSDTSSNTPRSSRSGSVTSKLGSFLADTIHSVSTNATLVSSKRRASLEVEDLPTSPVQQQQAKKKPREFRPLSTATRNSFKLSYGKTHLRVKIPTPKQIAKVFDMQERISPEAASALLAQSEMVMRRECNVLEINDRERVQIFGDIHGQYFDLRHALETSGYSLEDEGEDRTLLFMGDYVDRGAWSCEVLFFLLALKLARPSRVFLLRGNHECSAVVSFFGFKEEMECKYGQTLFNKSLVTFQAMPLCAIVSTPSKRWLVCHGGISPKLVSVAKDVGELNRFAEPGMNGLFCDLLWADPQMEIDEFAANPSRGCSVRFGKDALKKCLEDNQLDGLIRGHEVMEDGVGVQDQVITVFSAPNYCGRYGNRGAYVFIHPDRDYEAIKFDSVTNQPDPRMFDSVVLETNNRIVETLPFMPTTLGGFVNRALELYSATAAKAAQEEHVQTKMISSRNYEDDSLLEDDSLVVGGGGEEESFLQVEEEVREPLSAGMMAEEEEDGKERGEGAPLALEGMEEEEELDATNLSLAVVLPTSPKRTAFNIAKNKLSRAFSINKRFQTAKYSDGINEAHPSLTQFKIQSAELLLRMRFRKPLPATAPGTTIADNDKSLEEEVAVAAPVPDGLAPTEGGGFHPHHQRSRSAALDLDSSGESLLNLTNSLLNLSMGSDPPGGAPLRRVQSVDRLLPGPSSSSSAAAVTTAGATANQDLLLNMSVDSAYISTPPSAHMRRVRKRHAAELQFTPLGTPLSEVYPPIELAKRSSLPPPSTALLFPPLVVGDTATLRSPLATAALHSTPFHGSSSFSDSELKDLQLLFMLVDRSDDAQITFEEIIQWSQDEGEQVSELDAKRVVEAVDADRDGVIGLDDWLWFAHCCREVYNAELDEEIA